MNSVNRFINRINDHEEIIIVVVIIFGKYIITSQKHFINNFIIMGNTELNNYTYSYDVFINIFFSDKPNDSSSSNFKNEELGCF